MQKNKLVTVIVLAEVAPLPAVNEALKSVFSQTFKQLDIIVSCFKRNDLQTLKDNWKEKTNIRYFECDMGSLELLLKPQREALGDFIFYKSVNPVDWYPRHIEHHLDLFEWDDKSSWSFSFTELKNIVEKSAPANTINYKIDKTPIAESFSVDEFCHLKKIIVDWSKCIVTTNGANAVFYPGLIIKQLESYRVAIPEEITVMQWVDPRPKEVALGKPVSDKNIEVVIEKDGELDIKTEYPTVVGSLQWQDYNNNILNRISNLDPLSIKKIAVKRTIGMGDVLLAEPVVRALRRKYPNAAITFFASNSRNAKEIVPYFESKPDEIIGLENEQALIQDILYDKKGYDLRFDFDLAYESRKNINYIDGYFTTAGFKEQVKEVDGELTIVPDVPEHEKVPRLKYEEPRLITEHYVAVELGGSGWGGKEWDMGAWKQILNEIQLKGYKIAFVSNLRVAQVEGDPLIFTNPNNDFKVMLNYLRYCEFFVGSDCGPMHIAAAFNKRCFVIAGAALPKFTTKNPKVYQVTNQIDCLHCKGRQYVNQTDQGFTFVSKCENPKQYECMSGLKVEIVSKELEKFLKSI